eukprot:GHVR01061501.1.p1 GENE.GHVR01061501.1~~GHVR01061501.1.p1  ORF type:complete len:327 (-),score=91.08 GHVR01061501.1:51-1001(-)
MPYINKIGLVGSGFIGSTLAHLTALKQLGNVVMFDVVPDMPIGKALDLQQSGAVEGFDCTIKGTNDYASLEGCDAVIVTAGVPRKPGMSRDDLLSINTKIIRQVADGIRTYCSTAFVVVITNPLDAMVQLLQKESGLPFTHVVGMAGVLDASRFKTFISSRLGVSVQDIQAVVMGGHGDTMVALPRFCSVSGIPLPLFVEMGWITQQEIDEIVNRTANGGAEIVNYLKTGSAFYAPASSALKMVESYLKDKKCMVPCAAYCDKEYNVGGLYVGVPCVIGKGGVEKVAQLTLTDDENKQFMKSVEAVRELVKVLPEA